jgi:hypothetical protein
MLQGGQRALPGRARIPEQGFPQSGSGFPERRLSGLPRLQRRVRCTPCSLPRLVQATGIGEDEPLAARNQVVPSGLSLGQSRFPFHCRPVTHQKRDVVSLGRELRNVQLPFGGSTQRAVRFIDAVEKLLVEGELQIADRKIRIDCDRLPRGLDRSVVLAERWVDHCAQHRVRMEIARIRLRPRLAGLLRVFQVSRHLYLVGGRNEESLPVADAIPQLISGANVLDRGDHLSREGIGESQRRIGHRELRIELDGALQERDSGCEIVPRRQNLRSGAVGLQRFERWRRRLFERRIVLADSGQRFTDAGSELAGCAAQRVQNLFLSCRLHLLLIENVSGAAVLGP